MANIFYQFVLLEAVMPINCVQLKYIYIYSYWVKSTLSPQLYVLISEEMLSDLLLLLFWFIWVLFCFVFVW